MTASVAGGATTARPGDTTAAQRELRIAPIVGEVSGNAFANAAADGEGP